MMSKGAWGFTGAAFIVVVAVVILLFYFPGKQKQQLTGDSQLIRHISYTLAVTNKSSELIRKAELSVVGPNSHTANQRCEQIDADREFILHKDGLNNQNLKFSFDNLPPYAVKVINVRADVAMQPFSDESLLDDKENWLLDEQHLYLENRKMQQQAKKMLGKNDLETVTNVFTWITATLTKTGYSEKEKGALYALHKRGGDCTEFMHLFVALCRINQIPARGISGFIVTQDKHLAADELHDWAEVYLEGQWRLIDPYNKVFMDKEELYVVMRIHDTRLGGEFFYRWQTDDKRLHIAMVD